MPRRRAARARGPSRASLRRGAARTGCAVLGRRRAGAAAQRSRPTMTRAGRSGPARQTPASGAALNGLASGGATAERARDCRCRRSRLFRCRAAPARASAQGDCSDECGDVSPRGLSGGSYCESASDGDCNDYDVNWAWANVREDAWAECNEIGCISAAALAPPRRARVRAAPAVVEGGGFERRAWADDTSGSPGMGESVASKREARAAPSRPP